MALTRTQISLSDRQLRYLQRTARARGTSMADVVRKLVDREMASETPPASPPPPGFENHPWGSDPFFGIVGMAEGGRAETNEEMDAIIYRVDWK